MFTACPHCDFLVTHLSGQPRPETCPRCGKPMAAGAAQAAAPAPADAPPATPDTPATPAPALATLLDDEPPVDVEPPAGPQPVPTAGTGLEPASDAPVPALATPVAETEPAAEPEPVAAEPAIAAEAPSVVAPEPAPAAAAPAAKPPVAARTGTRAHALRGYWQWLLIALLGLLLGLQILLADRARLAADPDWRPLLLQACGLLHCTLPAWHEPTAFTMVERSVRPGQASGTLRVDATFRNDARWAQPWPTLQLSLSDADGRTTGDGVFAPEQYLGQPPDGLLAPGQSAQITFVVQEPAPGTVAFAFRFH